MTKDEAFARLGKSKFRSRFRLTAEDLAYIDRVGLATIWRHAEDFVLPEVIQSRQISWELHFASAIRAIAFSSKTSSVCRCSRGT